MKLRREAKPKEALHSQDVGDEWLSDLSFETATIKYYGEHFVSLLDLMNNLASSFKQC